MQTFGAFSMKKDWRSFINNLNIDSEFLHRDEFEKKYRIKNAKYPSAYLYENGNISLLISDVEMNSVNNLDEIEVLVLGKVNNLSYVTQITD
jgi:hypothetical protein